MRFVLFGSFIAVLRCILLYAWCTEVLSQTWFYLFGMYTAYTLCIIQQGCWC